MREPIRVPARLKVYRGARSARWGRETLIGTAPLSRTIARCPWGVAAARVARSAGQEFHRFACGHEPVPGPALRRLPARALPAAPAPYPSHREQALRPRYRIVTRTWCRTGSGTTPFIRAGRLGGDRSDASSRLLARCGGRGGHPAAPASRGCPVRSLPSAPGRAAGPVPRSRGPSHRREDRPA